MTQDAIKSELQSDQGLLQLFDFEYFTRCLTLAEYLVSLVSSAGDGEVRDQYREILCDDAKGFPADIFDFIVEESKSEAKLEQNQLEDIKWRIANLASVDGVGVNLVLVHLQLVYRDAHQERRNRNLVLSLEEFSRFYSSFLELSEAI